MGAIWENKKGQIQTILTVINFVYEVEINIQFIYYDEIKITNLVNHGEKGNGFKALNSLFNLLKALHFKRVFLDVYPQHDSNGRLTTIHLLKYYSDNFNFKLFELNNRVFQMYKEL